MYCKQKQDEALQHPVGPDSLLNGTCGLSYLPYETRDDLLAFIVHVSPKLRILLQELIILPRSTFSRCNPASLYLLPILTHGVAFMLV